MDPTLEAAFFQANDNALLVWMVDTVDRFEDLLDALPQGAAPASSYCCASCAALPASLHAETSSVASVCWTRARSRCRR